MKTDIIIPTYNQAALTVKCLDTLEAHSPTARIIWVDNGSSAEDLALVQARVARLANPVLPVLVSENLGFVKATNAGIALSTAPTIVLLNNDTEVVPGWLEMLQEVLDTDPTVGIVGPRSSSTHQWQGRTPAGSRWRLLSDRAMLAFFCAAIRREVITKCGYLSEEYGIGLADDDDYCARITHAGWKLALRHDLTILHHHRTTFRALYGEGGWNETQRANTAQFRKKWGRG